MKAGICLVYILVNPLRHSFNTSIILPSSLIIFSISSCNVLTSALTDLWLFYSSEKLYIWMMWAVFEVATFFFFSIFFLPYLILICLDVLDFYFWEKNFRQTYSVSLLLSWLNIYVSYLMLWPSSTCNFHLQSMFSVMYFKKYFEQ